MQNHTDLIQRMADRGLVRFAMEPKTKNPPGFKLPTPPGKTIQHPVASAKGCERYLKRVGRKTYTSHPELRGWPRKKYMKLYNAQRYRRSRPVCWPKPAASHE